MTAEQYKEQGNKAFVAKEFDNAVELFTKAIEIDPNNHVLYSNRSAAYASLKNYDKALEDADKIIEIKSDWAKGYSRKGAALHGLERLDEARKAYQTGLQIEPDNAQLKKSLEELEASLKQQANALFGSLFSQDLVAVCQRTPKLRPYLDHPDFVEKIKKIQANPSELMSNMHDPRLKELFNTLLLASIPNMPNDPMQTEETQETGFEANPSPRPASEPEPEPEPEPPKEKTEEELKKEEALKEKELGNAAYKKRQFEEALQHYDRAWELDSTNITILTNKAAVLFEQEEYEECIKVCEQAVETGFEQRANYTLLARALGRIGNAYRKLNNLDEAIKYYNKSLTEHRTADILNKLREVEKEKVKREKEAYYNPELSDAAREAGNDLFKKNDYANAVTQYTEAIKRNEKDHRAYGNRAACYTKLMAFPEAMKDCETCISLDPTVVKYYIRKAAVEYLTKEYAKCIETCEAAREHDKDGKYANEINQQIARCYASMQTGNESQEEVLRRAQQDPEISRILHDPAMQQILAQMQEDPAAIRTHMANPQVAANIRKLMQSGILKVS